MYDTTVNDTADAFPDDWLRRLLREAVRAGGLLETHDHTGLRLSLSETFALGELSEVGTLSQQELADRLGLEKSTVSRLAANLERRKWLTRERDPANRRYYRLRLTAQGRHAAKRVGGHFHSFHAKLFEALSPAEHAGLQLGLGGLIRFLEAERLRPSGDGAPPVDLAGHDTAARPGAER
ncbi:MAG: MarR family winged helix-turn-helix transcriptional regulator [Micromonosporaceae bacterium]